jgi:GT2 family glycosyltransferase
MPADADGYCYRARLIQNYSAVTGACLVTRAQLFAEAGGLNEDKLPVAFNDVDYCLRLRDKGYLVTWTPFARLYHFESASRGDDMAPDKIERFERERRFFAERWSSVLSSDPYYNPNLSIDEWPFALALKARAARPWRDA